MKTKNESVNIWGLDINMRIALVHADEVYRENGHELVITSARDGMHSAGSLHYYGLAIDTRTRFFTETEKLKVFEEIQGRLYPLGFDVVNESNHFHIEYDPKG